MRRKREHTGDEFGRPTLGAIRGLDGPSIGAPSNIIIDGIVERESGKTPSPPPFTIRTAVIFLVVMFLIGVSVVVVFRDFFMPPDETSQSRLSDTLRPRCLTSASTTTNRGS